MGVRGAQRIQQDLLTALPAATPVAVIQNASLPTQRHITTTLGELAASIAREHMASPSVIVVGDVTHAIAALRHAQVSALAPHGAPLPRIA